MKRSDNLTGDAWGGVAAMLVAVPSAIALGVAILSPLGPAYAARGALAGLLGAAAIGLVAPAFGGTRRLISAPCAPAAAVLAALAVELAARGTPPESAVVMIAVVILMCGALQIAFGAAGLGTLIKYMPYPVVSGYLSGVGLIIILSQIPKLLGVPSSEGLREALASPAAWNGSAIAVGLATMIAMSLAPRLTKAVPSTIIGLAVGGLVYAGLAFAQPALRSLDGNPLLIGSLVSSEGGFVEAVAGQWRGIRGIALADVQFLVMPALTLAVLLSIDTLKTCVVVDALTRSRHDSNRELIGQGLGNLASMLVGGVAGAGTMGPTLVNVRSGASTRLSGVVEGTAALAALLALSGLLAWLPVPALAGILIVVGALMIDRASLALLRSKQTILDFAVIVAVVVVAETVSLIAASAVGVGLAIMLFVREQIGGSVVRRKLDGTQTSSKQVRLPREVEILKARGSQTAIYELQGSLFFGTSDQLYKALAPELSTRKYIILEMRRVQSIDVTAAHMLDLIEDTLSENGGCLIFSRLPRHVPSGRDMEQYVEQVGLSTQHRVKVFDALDEALEWIEDRVLEEEKLELEPQKMLAINEIEVMQGRKTQTLADLHACMEERSVREGGRIFSMGEGGDELFLIRRGSVRIVLPVPEEPAIHLATLGRGDFFGEMSFLDDAPRSADAIADSDTDLFVLSRERFDAFTEEHRRAGLNLLEGLAVALARRLRDTNTELTALEEA